MASDVQETNLDAVEVDEDGNLMPKAVYEQDDSRLPLQSDGAAGGHFATGKREDEDGLSSTEIELLHRCQSQKADYSGDGTAEESEGMLAMARNMGDDVDSDSSASYLGLESYPELTPAAAVSSFNASNAGDPSPSGEPSHMLHDFQLSYIDTQQVTGAAHAHSLERGEEPSHPKRHRKGLLGLVDLIVTFFRASSADRLALFFAIVAIVVGIALLCSLLPASFVYVEYYELALAKSRISGRVNRDDVYHPGCYLLTPDIELVRFKGTAHTLDLKVDLSTSDRLSFDLGISLQYFIKPKELGLLHQDYEQNYEGVVKSMVISTLKNEGVKFSLDHFRLSRSQVEKHLKEALAYRLGGDCCPSCCPKRCGPEVDCRFGCRLPGRCKSKGIHMEMRYFQMGIVDIPDDVAERFLRRTVLQIEAEKELFVQQHAVETKISERERKKILNEAAEIREKATAEAKKIRTVSEAEYEKQVQGSYTEALKKFYQHLNVTQENHKLSLMYIRALEDMSDNLYNLNFEKYTAVGSP